MVCAINPSMENTTRPENTDVTCFQLSKTAQLVTLSLSDSVSHLLISKHCRAVVDTCDLSDLDKDTDKDRDIGSDL